MKKFFLLFFLVILSSIGCNQSEEAKITDKSNNSENKQISEPKNNPEPQNNDVQKNRKILAKVNGVPIYEDELRGKTLDRAITEEALYQDGLRNGLDKEFADQLARLKKGYIVQYNKQRIRELFPLTAITNEEIETYYHQNPDRYTRIYFEEINFPQKGDAEKIKKMIEEGKNFDSIAQKYNDAGFVYNKVEDNNLKQYFSKTEVGEVSDIVEKPNGTYSILKISNIYVVPYNHVLPSIKYLLKAKQFQEAIDTYIKNQEDKKEIEIEYVN